jgi:hypothetical protein
MNINISHQLLYFGSAALPREVEANDVWSLQNVNSLRLVRSYRKVCTVNTVEGFMLVLL